ncbi:MAG: response regulator [Calditrichaeota bacterium]|nr:MAG: response regulator [Calditrichota bacterium]
MSKKILIVDDEEIIVDILKRRFTRMGFSVLESLEGSHAIDLLQREPVDLVVCDVKMPDGTSGTDVLRATRKYRPGAPFVAISGLLMTDESVQEFLRNGAALFIKKPFASLRDVTEQIAALVDTDA